jgi:probable addiction module antidote protein
MKKTTISNWDASEYLHSEEDMAEYLSAAMEEDDPKLMRKALNDVARAKGMTELAHETGVSRDTLYKGLSENGNPSFTTIQKIVSSLGCHLKAVPA